MNTKQTIRKAMEGPEFVVNAYLGDLSDAELLSRPVAGANHILWQLGHLVGSEHNLMEAAFPGKMPPLPAGFKDKYNNETAKSDNPQTFHTKAEVMQARQQQRAGTLAILESLSDADFDKPAPEQFRAFCPTIGDLFLLQGSHTMMHAGQWAVTRRKLGRPPLF